MTGSLVPASGAPAGTRTQTERFLRPLPLPLGYGGGRSVFQSQGRGAAEHGVEHRLGELAGEGVLLRRVVAAQQRHGPARRRPEHSLDGVAEAWLGPGYVVP